MIEIKGKIIVFGGIHEVTYELNDTWCFDLQKGGWINLDEDTSHRKKNTHSNSDYSAILKKDNSEVIQKKTQSKNLNVERKLVENLMVAKRVTSKSPHKGLSAFKESSIMKTNDSFESTTKLINSSAILDKKKKVMHIKKLQMLSEFESENDQISKLDLNSPTTVAMKYSINNISLANNSPRNNHKGIPLKINGNFIEIAKNLVANTIETVRKPYPRDGHSTVVFEEKMIVFGGDRHLISFDDIYSCDLSGI